jgi:hypothetical protein
MALSPEQTFRIAKFVLITFTTLTIIATFVGYGVVIHATNLYIDTPGADKNTWKAWRAVNITYLVIQDIVALVGLFGAIKEHYCLTLSYGIAMTVLWFFNFSNRALAKNNVFNYLVAIGVIFSAFYFALKIRRRQYPCSSIGGPQVIVSPAPAVIQVEPSYVPNQSVYTVQTGSSPPPPYSTASQPQLAFKY